LIKKTTLCFLYPTQRNYLALAVSSAGTLTHMTKVSEAPAQDLSTPRRAAAVLGITGEFIITLGLIVALFAVYQLWWTNVAAAVDTNSARAQTLAAFDNDVQTAPAIGQPFALLFIPRLRPAAWDLPILQGVESAQLRSGVGHYPDTALPGVIGNMGIAGHRATNGEPLANVDKLRNGDPIIIQTGNSWYTYTI
jgi:sortase A